jgi:hypothetical protein
MRRLTSLLIVALLATTLVACTTKSADSVATGDTTPATPDATDAAPDQGERDDAAGSDDFDVSIEFGDESTPPAGFEDFGECFEASMAFFALLASPLAFMGGATDEQLAEFEAEVAELEASIPAEIRDDYETVAEAYRGFGETLQAAGGNLFDPRFVERMEAAEQQLEAPEVVAAQERIETYFDEVCG